MKTLKLLAIGILLVSSSIQAQVSVNLNIGQLLPGALDTHKQNTIICQMFKLIMTLELLNLFILETIDGEIKILAKTIPKL
jgi:hypothetical protein